MSMNPSVGTQWIHARTGRRYTVLAEAKVEATQAPVIVYQGTGPATGEVWVRPRSEFQDGRFVPVPATLLQRALNGLARTLAIPMGMN